MNAKPTDSVRTQEVIAYGKEITKLVYLAVTADRHSRTCNEGPSGCVAIKAAQRRDTAFNLLRKRLEQIAWKL